jgi:hypothetical protein
VRPVLLNLDDALERQEALGRAVARRGGRVVPARDLGPALRLWSRAAPLQALRRRLADGAADDGEAELVFAGSGDFHHVTPLLLERAVARVREAVTVVHFDNHPDWARFAPGRHCGSWVGRAARMDGVRQVVTVGVTSADVGAAKARQGDLALVAEGRLEIFAWAAPDGAAELSVGGRGWPTCTGAGEAAFLMQVDAAVRSPAIYVTIDKDVLRRQDAVTNWDQGQASLGFLDRAVRLLARGRRLVGADVVGDWSSPGYGRGPAGWLKRGEAFLDQPRRRPDRDAADAVNQAANLRLLQLFAGAGA